MKTALFLLFVFYSASAVCQSTKRCELLRYILANDRVQKGLKLDHSGAPLILFDRSRKFMGCVEMPFGDHVISIVSNDSVAARGNPLVKFRDSSSYFVIMKCKQQSRNYYSFEIVHPYSGLKCEGLVRGTRDGYILSELHLYVL